MDPPPLLRLNFLKLGPKLVTTGLLSSLYAPVAQLDRAHAYEAWGRAFESLRVRIQKPPEALEAFEFIA